MNWNKLGKIFDPTQHKLANNCVEFAQSPQTLVFEEFIRIYFSTREKDSAGKYISHIAYIDMDKEFKELLKISNHTIITMGELGCYDEHGIFPFNVLRDNTNILGFIGGWSRRVSVDIETSIGLAISTDNGETFKRIGAGPVLSSTLDEPFLVGDPFVQKINNKYHMWYIYGTNWIQNPSKNVKERVYKIGHAISDDAVNWRKTNKQLIADKLNENECQALPSVIFHNNKYHMVFCYRQALGFRENSKDAYRLGYAFSDDGLNWQRDDENIGIEPTVNSWDSDMMCYPHIFSCNNNIYLLYNGNNFGRFGFGLAVLEN
jgi:sucrose-6-phosphate hydrolase SacC (GH32 family)